MESRYRWLPAESVPTRTGRLCRSPHGSGAGGDEQKLNPIFFHGDVPRAPVALDD